MDSQWPEIITSASVAPDEIRMATREDVQRAIDAVTEEPLWKPAQYVIGRAPWSALLAKADDAFREELEAMEKSGMVIVSDYLPDPENIAYRIELSRTGTFIFPEPGTRYYPDSWNAQ